MTLLWIDLETTGLEPEFGHILEMTWFTTTDDLNWTGSGHTYLLIAPTGWPGFCLPEVRWMHEDSGLMADWTAAWQAGELTPLPEVEDKLVNALSHLDEQPLLAGSNCDFERRWLESKMPRVARRLSHRALDVSRLRSAFRLWAGEDNLWQGQPAVKHRSAYDLVDHLYEANHYRTLIQGLPR